MYLYIMRHGETDDNTKRVLQGQKDNPLNENGRKQAEEARFELEGITFDKIYVSPLIRAVQTAELATGRDREEFIIEERIKEIGFGVLEGTVSDDMKMPYRNFFFNPAEYEAPKGGETLAQLSGRVWDFLQELKGTLPGQKVLLVSHGAAIHAMVNRIQKKDMSHFWDMRLGNCGVLEVSDESGEYKIIKECEKRDSNYTRF